MLITLFERNRVETFTSLAAAAYAVKTWYSDLENETPSWDYEIQSFDGLLEAIEEHKKRIAAATRHSRCATPRLAAIAIEED
jgi:predicted FMN-binding regulatory protein PaiB